MNIDYFNSKVKPGAAFKIKLRKLNSICIKSDKRFTVSLNDVFIFLKK